jgi:LysM repeat protein
MTERGLPSVDGAAACPFVAFEDDRESRSASPDHRHRCYAEPLPAPRAAAHQEAYCLSGAFPVCPTFQDWARREAAHARGEGERPIPATSATARPGAASSSTDPGTDHDDDDAAEELAPVRPPIEEPPIRRNPPRDWAAPPPWASGGVGGSGAAGARRSADTRGVSEGSGPPDFLAGRADEGAGLAGSAADRLAAGAPGSGSSATPSARVSAAAPPDEELADLVSSARVGDRPVRGYQPPKRPGNRPSVSSTRSVPRDAITGPAWERSRRYEAYPTIRTRVGLPQLPRIGVLAVALAVAALGLFFLPALLGVGGGGGDIGSASPSASQSVATSSPAPTTPPGPTPQVYVIAAGDTLSKVATRFGLTLEELLAANKDTISNPDKIAIGDEIVIPSKPPDVINDASAEPTAAEPTAS